MSLRKLNVSESLEQLYFQVPPINASTYLPCRFGIYLGVDPHQTTTSTARFVDGTGARGSTANFPTSMLFLPDDPGRTTSLDEDKVYREQHANATAADKKSQVVLGFDTEPVGLVNVKISVKQDAGGNEIVVLDLA